MTTIVLACVLAVNVLWPAASEDSEAAMPVLESSVPGLVRIAGQWRLNGEPARGILVERYRSGALISSVRLRDGWPHRVQREWYENGREAAVRVYARGRKIGRHEGWWPSGLQRFDATYQDDAYQGEYRTWHENGRLYELRHFVDGHEEGTQRSWTPAGELYLNYEVRGGRRYGFANARPCLPVEGGRSW